MQAIFKSTFCLSLLLWPPQRPPHHWFSSTSLTAHSPSLPGFDQSALFVFHLQANLRLPYPWLPQSQPLTTKAQCDFSWKSHKTPYHQPAANRVCLLPTPSNLSLYSYHSKGSRRGSFLVKCLSYSATFPCPTSISHQTPTASHLGLPKDCSTT